MNMSLTYRKTELPVLILSDNQSLRAMISRLVSVHECVGASLSEAPALVADNDYACIFMECGAGVAEKIPYLCGFQGDYARSPIVAVMHRDEPEEILKAIRSGAQDCLPLSGIGQSNVSAAMVKAKETHAYRKSRHMAEEELQQIRKMEAIGRLTSGVAHDFNNLLTVVMGNIHLLRRRFLNGIGHYDPQDIMTKIEAIETVTDKGAELVRRLMVFTRQTPLTREAVQVNTCVRESCELLKRAIGETIELEVLTDQDDWEVLIDPLEFENMLINFAVNARDAMPNGGKLTIETQNIDIDAKHAMYHPDMKTGAYVMISISDTGVGMTPEVIKNVFEPFFTTKPPGEGTGLGMSMAYGFVKQCGGYLHVYSELGNGSVFRVYLPRFSGHAPSAHADEVFFSEQDTKGMVLVVDDDIVMRTIACATLQGLGYEVAEAMDARSALEILKSKTIKVDLLFTDIYMPGEINGIDLAKIVREKFPSIEVLLTSGYSSNSIPPYIANAGEEIISKPYRADLLKKKIETLKSRRRYAICEEACARC